MSIIPLGQLNAAAWPWTKPAAELGWQPQADALGDERDSWTQAAFLPPRTAGKTQCRRRGHPVR